MQRAPVNPRDGAKGFSHDRKKTKRINLAPPPMRGGFRI